MAERYNVAFVYSAEAGAYAGVITWTSFPDKAAFDAWYDDEVKRTQTVLEEGISDERGEELAKQTPRSILIRAGVSDLVEQRDPMTLLNILALKL